MRIIGEIPHAHYKITVFKHNNRVSVKFENANYEQVYRFPEGIVENFEQAALIVTDGKLGFESAEIMTSMHQAALRGVQSLKKGNEDEEFEKII